MPDPVEIIIRIVGDEAKQQLQQVAAAGQKAAADVGRAWETSWKGASSGAGVMQQQIARASKAMAADWETSWKSAGSAASMAQQQIVKGNQAIIDSSKAAAQALNAFKVGLPSAPNMFKDMNEQLNKFNVALPPATAMFGKLVQSTQTYQVALPGIAKGQDEVTKGIMSISQAYTNMRIAAEVQQGITYAWQAIASSIKEANDHMDSLYNKMAGVRERSVELARLLGKEPTAQFTTEQATEAFHLKVRPEQWETVQKTARQQAGGLVAPLGVTGADVAKGGYRTSEERFASLQKLAAPWALNKLGITPEQTGKAIGFIAQMSTPETTDTEMMNEFVKFATGVERAKGETSGELERFSILATTGEVKPGDWEGLHKRTSESAMVARRRSGQVVAYGTAVDDALDKLESDQAKQEEDAGTSDIRELGINPKTMNRREKFQKIKEARDRWVKGGKTENLFWSKYFGTEKRRRAGMRAMIEEGIDQGGFAAADEEQRLQTGAKAQEETQKVGVGEVAQDRAMAALNQAAEFGQAAHDVRWQQRKARAQADLTASGVLRRPEYVIDALQTASGVQYKQGGRAEAEIKRYALSSLEQEAQAKMYDPSVKNFAAQQGFGKRPEFWEMPQKKIFPFPGMTPEVDASRLDEILGGVNQLEGQPRAAVQRSPASLRARLRGHALSGNQEAGNFLETGDPGRRGGTFSRIGNLFGEGVLGPNASGNQMDKAEALLQKIATENERTNALLQRGMGGGAVAGAPPSLLNGAIGAPPGRF